MSKHSSKANKYITSEEAFKLSTKITQLFFSISLKRKRGTRERFNLKRGTRERFNCLKLANQNYIQ